MLHYETVTPITLRLLKTLSGLRELSGFSLAGGTALALQLGHHISVDLDFFGNRPFTTDEILDVLQGIKPLSESLKAKIFLF